MILLLKAVLCVEQVFFFWPLARMPLCASGAGRGLLGSVDEKRAVLVYLGFAVWSLIGAHKG